MERLVADHQQTALAPPREPWREHHRTELPSGLVEARPGGLHTAQIRVHVFALLDHRRADEGVHALHQRLDHLSRGQHERREAVPGDDPTEAAAGADEIFDERRIVVEDELLHALDVHPLGGSERRVTPIGGADRRLHLVVFRARLRVEPHQALDLALVAVGPAGEAASQQIDLRGQLALLPPERFGSRAGRRGLGLGQAFDERAGAGQLAGLERAPVVPGARRLLVQPHQQIDVELVKVAHRGEIAGPQVVAGESRPQLFRPGQGLGGVPQGLVQAAHPGSQACQVGQDEHLIGRGADRALEGQGPLEAGHRLADPPLVGERLAELAERQPLQVGGFRTLQHCQRLLEQRNRGGQLALGLQRAGQVPLRERASLVVAELLVDVERLPCTPFGLRMTSKRRIRLGEHAKAVAQRGRAALVQLGSQLGEFEPAVGGARFQVQLGEAVEDRGGSAESWAGESVLRASR